MIHPDDSAFPVPSQKIGGVGLTDGGLTKREYIAARVMVGWLAAHADPEVTIPDSEEVARDVVEYTDALLAELSKPARHAKNGQR